MKLYILLAILTTTMAANENRGIFYNGRYNNFEILKEGVNHIHQMVLNKKENTLYFTFDQISTVPTRVLGYLNIDTRNAGLIHGVRNATCLTVDQDTNTVYVGGSDGIYKVNGLTSTVESLPIRDDIAGIFFKNYLFYVNRRKDAYVFQNGFINRVFELQDVQLDNIILDDDDNMFFMQGRMLLRVKIGTRAVNTHEKYNTDLIAVDNYFKPYVATRNGLYVYNKYKYVLDKVSDLTNLRALTFSKDDEPIYAIHDAIYKINFSQ